MTDGRTLATSTADSNTLTHTFRGVSTRPPATPTECEATAPVHRWSGSSGIVHEQMSHSSFSAACSSKGETRATSLVSWWEEDEERDHGPGVGRDGESVLNLILALVGV